MVRFSTLFLGIGFIFMSMTTNAMHDPLESLFSKMSHRFLLMERVAAYKHMNQLPTVDETRERVVLDDIVKIAISEGLDPDWAEGFTQEMMDISKNIQMRYRELWAEDENALDMTIVNFDTVRAKISQLTEDIIQLVVLLASRLRDDMAVYEDMEKAYEANMRQGLILAAEKQRLFDKLLEVELRSGN